MKKMSNCVQSCPCGCYGDLLKPCTCCAAVVVTKDQKRISGPMLDRIDIHIAALSYKVLLS
jgi:predicted ATPase with chaperone activity